MNEAMKKLLVGLHVEQTENQKSTGEANLYNEHGQWIAEVAYADMAEAMVAAVNEIDVLRDALQRIADNAERLEPMEVRNLALAALGGGLEKIKGMTK